MMSSLEIKVEVAQHLRLRQHHMYRVLLVKVSGPVKTAQSHSKYKITAAKFIKRPLNNKLRLRKQLPAILRRYLRPDRASLIKSSEGSYLFKAQILKQPKTKQ